MCINYAKECRLPSSHRPEAVRFPLSIGRASYKSQKINNHGCTQKQHRKLKHILHLLSPARGIKKLVGTQQRFTLCSKVGTRLVATETSSPSLFSSPLKQPPSRAMSHPFLFFLFFFLSLPNTWSWRWMIIRPLSLVLSTAVLKLPSLSPPLSVSLWPAARITGRKLRAESVPEGVCVCVCFVAKGCFVETASWIVDSVPPTRRHEAHAQETSPAKYSWPLPPTSLHPPRPSSMDRSAHCEPQQRTDSESGRHHPALPVPC